MNKFRFGGARLVQPYGMGNTAGFVCLLIKVNKLKQLLFRQRVGFSPSASSGARIKNDLDSSGSTRSRPRRPVSSPSSSRVTKQTPRSHKSPICSGDTDQLMS